MTAVRAIPPAPPRRASLSAITRLEGLCADAWPALVDERLGAWRLRAAGGFTARANSALAIGDPGMPTAAALATVRAFAERHGIPPRVQAPVGSPWDKAVAAQGWVLDVGHAAGALVSVQVADLARLAAVAAACGAAGGAAAGGAAGGAAVPAACEAAACGAAGGAAVPTACEPAPGGAAGGAAVPAACEPAPGGAAGGAGGAADSPAAVGVAGEPTDSPTAEALTVEVGAPDDAWWRLVLGDAPTPAQRHVLAGSCAEKDALALVSAHGMVGAGRVVVVEDHLHLSMLTVDPAVRRRGHATALLAAGARWGRERGARWGVLQVAVHNTAALALYARTGWTEHHRYRYLVPPGPA